jgi:hypothetical protein
MRDAIVTLALTTFFLGLAVPSAHARWEWTEVLGSDAGYRRNLAMAHDSARGVTVLLGGARGSGSSTDYLDDTWEWDGSTWSRMAPSYYYGRIHHRMVYDSASGLTLLFGGITDTGYGWLTYAGTEGWDGSSWTYLATTGPGPRFGHGMAYDSQRDVTVLFGGRFSEGAPTSAVDYRDTWEWDGSSWTQVATTGPSARSFHGMAYDWRRGVTVLFGGQHFDGGSATYYGDTWEWDGSSWTRVATTGPGLRTPSAGMAYDGGRRVTVLFGDLDEDMNFLGDTWEWDGSSWTQVATSGPDARFGHGMAYDATRRRLVLYGGNAESGGDQRDTWEYAPVLVPIPTASTTGIVLMTLLVVLAGAITARARSASAA